VPTETRTLQNKRVATLMFYLRTKLHKRSSSGTLIISNGPKAKQNVRSTVTLFYIPAQYRITLTRVSYFPRGLSYNISRPKNMST
jgi:hypothetical protein